MLEYALLVALLALIAIAAVRGFGEMVGSSFDSAARQVPGVGVICDASNPAYPDC